MAVDPKQMDAWVNEDKKDEKPAPAGDAGGGEEGDGGDLVDHFPQLMEQLMEYGELIEEAVEILDPEALASEEELSEEEAEMLGDAVASLPEELQAALVEEGGELSMEIATEIASALEGEGIIEAPERVAGFLFHAALHAATLEVGEDEEPAEDDLEDADLEGDLDDEELVE